jgi:hypothetical protein
MDTSHNNGKVASLLLITWIFIKMLPFFLMFFIYEF